jgi:alkyl sulfatase BDS1-like metallo-beta-lactamase superfamily hydrolase
MKGFRSGGNPWIPVLLTALLLSTCEKARVPEGKRVVPSPEVLRDHCEKIIAEPRVEQVSPHVWVALGYDLANTALIHTDEGNVIVDPSMSPARARQVRQALYDNAPRGPVLAIIYTHSHIDHVGGASAWAEEDTAIWATEAFVEHFFKQYGLFRPIETVRGMRQFGHHVSRDDLPCSALGARPDIDAALEMGVVMPTHTFTGKQPLRMGGLTIELHEAHGETHDQLFVWVPEDSTLIPADNFYWAFPNLYTIRGTSPRPVDQWIKSLDAMRRREPKHLVPMHTKPSGFETRWSAAPTEGRTWIRWQRRFGCRTTL